MSDAMTVNHSPNSWAEGPLENIRTIRTERDWVLHTADSIQATLEAYGSRRLEYADELRADDPHAADLLERILAIYGEPPGR